MAKSLSAKDRKPSGVLSQVYNCPVGCDHSSGAPTESQRKRERDEPSPLSSEAAAIPAPNERVLLALTDALAQAKSGNIKAVAIAYVLNDKPYTGSSSGIMPGDIHSAALLTCAIDELMHEWQHAKRGRG